MITGFGEGETAFPARSCSNEGSWAGDCGTPSTWKPTTLIAGCIGLAALDSDLRDKLGRSIGTSLFSSASKGPDQTSRVPKMEVEGPNLQQSLLGSLSKQCMYHQIFSLAEFWPKCCCCACQASDQVWKLSEYGLVKGNADIGVG